MGNGKFSFWTEEDVKKTLPKRGQESYKGTYGTGLLLAGSRDMPGAAIIAGLGAMRAGIGKLVIGTSDDVIPLIVPVLPEATYWRNALEEIAENGIGQTFRAAAIGPGLPPGEKVEQVLFHAMALGMPLVLDAGALANLPASFPEKESPLILTPHPGEFSKMIGMNVEELQRNRVDYAREWAVKKKAILVLKGFETVVAFPEGEVYINRTGNAALAKGGTGDALTGMMLGMICCHENIRHAVLNAVYLHGACADRWIERKSRIPCWLMS